MPALVLITGASRGLGAALARSVPWPDAEVVDVSRSGPADAGIDHLSCDLASPAGWTLFADGLRELLDRRTPERLVLVHNAGTLRPIGFAGEVDSDAYTQQVLLDAAAPQVVGHLFLTLTRHLDRPRDLVFITSGAATSAYEGWSAYGAGKAAVDHWVRTVGAEQRRRGGARVVAIAPGVVDTDMQADIREMDEHDFPAVDRFRTLHAEGDLLEPDEVAERLWARLDRLATGSVVDLRSREEPA